MSRCVACLQGDFHECREKGNCGTDGSANGLDNAGIVSGGVLSGAGDLPSDNVSDAEPQTEAQGEPQEERTFRTYKDDSALRDQQSTGRKRAAKMYPFVEDGPCEWRMKKNCGGGQFPIVGCLNGIQEARHHGPDKNTLNNEEGNVHRICHYCHNRWHTMNDPNYIWGSAHEPHVPLPATVVDIAMNEEYWEGKSLVKAKD